MAAEQSPFDDEAPGDPLLGSLIDGRFRVMKLIGEGGMGRVYDALHEGLGRPVAIKVLGAAWASDEQAIRRFQREARTASSIGHRAIIDISDLGRLDDGRPYLVMERLHGDSFADLLDEHGRLEAERVAHLVGEVASALDAVHARGIVHRDIKPENLITVADPEGGAEQVKLLDFGLAAFALPGAETARLTRHGQMHGTPHYMAPEAAGENLPDYRADVYSLAVVAFELLTGSVPFDSNNPLQILTRRMHEDPPTMREQAGLDLGDALERVLARGLARDPQHRYASAGELAWDLMAAVRATPDDVLRVSGTLPKASREHFPATMEEDVAAVPATRSSHPPLDPGSPLASGVVRSDADAAGLLRSRNVWASAAVALLVTGAVAAVLLTRGTDSTPDGTSTTPSSPVTRSAQPETPAPAIPPDEPPSREATPHEESSSGSDTEGEDDKETQAADEETTADPGEAEERDTQTNAERRRAARRARKRRAAREADEPTGEPDEAAPSSDEQAPSLAKTDRARARELVQEGQSMLVQGRLPDAIAKFREATMAHSGNASAWRSLGLANERLGREPEAARAYRRYLRIAPGAGDADTVRQRLDALE
ncbi:MAG: protein kinase domain-containing protein [Myxococcota bacterium]